MATITGASLAPVAGNPISAKDVLSKHDGAFPMDEAVIEALPAGHTFVSVEGHGLSRWTITGQVFTTKEDGTETSFFLKVAYGEHGQVMLRGEFESAKIIHSLTSDLIPEPHAFGQYKSVDPAPTFFYLSEFIDMDVKSHPKPQELGSKLAELHEKSVYPAGKFGFHVVTCDGKMPHTVDWEDNWGVFYGKLLRGVYMLDTEANGEWAEMARATEQVITAVIPRLLGNLTQYGEPIKPCIIHGDFWEPNLGISLKTGKMVMYDVGSYYAHNEMDLGNWRAGFSKILRSSIYTDSYLEHHPKTEPVAEFEDRLRLYSLKGSINYSAGHPGFKIRQTAYNTMCYLCAKYAPIDGIDEYDPQLDPMVTGEFLQPTFVKQDG